MSAAVLPATQHPYAPAAAAPIPDWITGTRRGVLRILYDVQHRPKDAWKRVFASAGWLSRQLDVARETVSRALSWLRGIGVLHRTASPVDPYGKKHRRSKETIVDWLALAALRDAPEIPLISRPLSEVSEVEGADPIASTGLQRIESAGAEVAAQPAPRAMDAVVSETTITTPVTSNVTTDRDSGEPLGMTLPPTGEAPQASEAGQVGGIDFVSEVPIKRAATVTRRASTPADLSRTDLDRGLTDAARRTLALLMAASGDRLASVDAGGWRRIARALRELETARDLSPGDRAEILRTLPWLDLQRVSNPVAVIWRVCVADRDGVRALGRIDTGRAERWAAWCRLEPALRAAVRAQLGVAGDLADAALMRDGRALHTARMIVEANEIAQRRARTIVEVAQLDNDPATQAAREAMLREGRAKLDAVVDQQRREREREREAARAARAARLGERGQV